MLLCALCILPQCSVVNGIIGHLLSWRCWQVPEAMEYLGTACPARWSASLPTTMCFVLCFTQCFNLVPKSVCACFTHCVSHSFHHSFCHGDISIMSTHVSFETSIPRLPISVSLLKAIQENGDLFFLTLPYDTKRNLHTFLSKLISQF